MKRPQAGFTLIELLIASGVLTVILLIVGAGLHGGSSALQLVVSRSEVVEDSRVAGQLIADTLARAAFVYPPGVILDLGTDYAVRTPGKADGTRWTVGTDPIVAAILPPEDITKSCPADPAGCATFVAYYAVSRQVVESFATGADRLPQNGNSNEWTLFEARASLPFASLVPATSGAAPPPLPTSLAGDGLTAGLLADYIRPSVGGVSGFALAFEPGVIACRKNEPTGKKYAPYDCPTLSANIQGGSQTLNRFTTITRATVQIQPQYMNRGVASLAPQFVFPVAPRNLYVQ